MPPVLRTLLVYSCYKLQLLLKYMCIYILTYNNYKQAMFLILGGLKDGSVKPKLVAQL